MFRDQSRDSGFETVSQDTADAADSVKHHASTSLTEVLQPPKLDSRQLTRYLHDEQAQRLEAFALALYDAGYGRSPGRRKSIPPAQWIVETLGTVLSVPSKNEDLAPSVPLHIQIGYSDMDDGREPLILVGGDEIDGMRDALPLLQQVEAEIPALKPWLARAMDNSSRWLAGPEAYEDIARRFYWEGEEDEEGTAQSYLEADEEYSGVRRADFDAAYPAIFKEIRKPQSRRQLRLFPESREPDLKLLARSHPMHRRLIRIVAAMLNARRQVIKAAKDTSALYKSPFDLGYDDWFWFRYALKFGDEELSELLIDEAYNMCMQCGYCSYMEMFVLPDTASEAQALVRALRATRDEYVATLALVKEMERACLQK